MLPVPRRSFLEAATLGTVAALLPDRAEAADLITGRIAELRARWAEQRRDYLDTVFADRPGADRDPLHASALAIGDGLGALATYKDLEVVPPEDQAHPAMQALIHDVSAAIGGAVRATREVLEGFLAGADDDPHRDTHLQAVLRTVRFGLSDWKTSVGRQRNLELAVETFEREADREGLLRRLRRDVKRLRKAEVLAESLAARQDQTGLLALDDAALAERVAVGRARWAQDDPAPPAGAEPKKKKTGLVVLGVLVMGIGAVGGTILLALGGCGLACGGGAIYVLPLVLGAGLIGLAIWGGIALVRRGSEPETAAHDLGPLLPRQETGVAVLAAEGWVPTGVMRGEDAPVLVEASGLVRAPGSWLADPDGSGVLAGETALVAGAPIGALVGRVGGDRFFLGRLGRVPDGPSGPIELAVNRVDDRCKGHFAARLRVYERRDAG